MLKILGENSDNLIVEMSKTDYANITGCDSATKDYMPDRIRNRTPLDVSARWKFINGEMAKDTITHLTGYKSSLDHVNTVITRLINELKEMKHG